MSHVDLFDGKGGENDCIPRGSYQCNNLEDALKQMEGLMEETMKPSAKRKKPLSTSNDSRNNTPTMSQSCSSPFANEKKGSRPSSDCYFSEPSTEPKMNGSAGIEFILDQFVSEQQDFLHPYHVPRSSARNSEGDFVLGSIPSFKSNRNGSRSSDRQSRQTEDMIASSLKMNSQCDGERQDFLTENSTLKLKLAKVEGELKEKDEKMIGLEMRVTELQSLLNDRMIELGQLKSKLAKSNPSSPERSLTSSFRDRTLEREQTLERLKKKHVDVEKLKSAVETLMISNEEKNVRIEEMKGLLKKYRKLEEMVVQKQGPQILEECGFDSKAGDPYSFDLAENKLAQSSDQVFLHPPATSTPLNLHSSVNGCGAPLPPSTLPSPIKTDANGPCSVAPQQKSPPAVKRQTVSSGGFGEDVLKDEMAQQYKAMLDQPPIAEAGKRKLTGKAIKKLFTKLKRSNSQDFDDKVDDFKRAGLRSTAGPRLGGWGRGIEYDFDIPFGRWDVDRVAMWLHLMGLSMYVGECKRWVKGGNHLLTATSHDLEKELGMKNAFHRRKLQLALQVMTSDPHSPMAHLDHTWVAKWLDDIGLPQYKDQFCSARIDGRMINYLTYEDLTNLKVLSLLHHLSFKCGIQVLRNNNFNPSCLRRRPATDESFLQNCPDEVVLWTNHRVMEWLRSIDLSEYAPNLRGSGVHGGLMVLEPRFSAEVLAAILSIPSNKTLLRRHLTTHFVALVGNSVQQQKRNIENDPNFVPLTTNQKVKPSKKIGLFRPKTVDLKDDFVCPLDARSSSSSSSHKLDVISKPPDVLAKHVPNSESSYGDQSNVQEVTSSNV